MNSSRADSRRSNLMERAVSTLTNCGTGLSSTAPSTSPAGHTPLQPGHPSHRSGKGRGRADKLRGEVSLRVRRVLKKDPTLSMTRLSEKANVSRGYASQARAQALGEHQHNLCPGR